MRRPDIHDVHARIAELRGDELAEGWGWPINSHKAHYFTGGEMISLCRKWMYTGRREDDLMSSPDNCAACMNKLRKLQPERFAV